MRGNALKKYNTKQREQILAVFSAEPGKCFSAKELIGLVPDIGQATVYRTISLLESEGVIRRYRGTDSDSFRLSEACDEPDHIHIVCKTCGEMLHSDCHFIGEMYRHLLDEHSFMLDTSDTVIYGTCRSCAEAGGKS